MKRGIFHVYKKVVSTLADEDLLINQIINQDYYFLGVKIKTNEYVTENNFKDETIPKGKKVGFVK